MAGGKTFDSNELNRYDRTRDMALQADHWISGMLSIRRDRRSRYSGLRVDGTDPNVGGLYQDPPRGAQWKPIGSVG